MTVDLVRNQTLFTRAGPAEVSADQRSGRPLRVGILGSGNVGMDLLHKVMASNDLRCDLIAGRRADSPGLLKAEGQGVPTSADGISAVVSAAEDLDLVFDATTALDAERHWRVLEPTGVQVVDLTPANIGALCVPALNLEQCLGEQYVSMISCGGQAAVPMARCFSEAAAHLGYLEIASASAAVSVGPATRANIDEYVVTTERATREFTGVSNTKTILIINPATPEIVMRNSVSVSADESVDLDLLRRAVVDMEATIKSYVPGYQVVLPPVATADRIMLTVEVEGRGDWFPPYAGNLDIITCAAMALAQARARTAR